MTMSESAKMELDVCWDGYESLAAALKDLVNDLSVVTEVVTEHGPAGGWPIVRFTGSAADLAVVKQHFGD